MHHDRAAAICQAAAGRSAVRPACGAGLRRPMSFARFPRSKSGLWLAGREAETAVLPPGNGGVGTEPGLAQDGPAGAMADIDGDGVAVVGAGSGSDRRGAAGRQIMRVWHDEHVSVRPWRHNTMGAYWL